jgi:hypothetical protein
VTNRLQGIPLQASHSHQAAAVPPQPPHHADGSGRAQRQPPSPGVALAKKVRRRFHVVKVARRAMAPKASRGTAIAISLPGRSHGVDRPIRGLAVLLLNAVMLTRTTPLLT